MGAFAVSGRVLSCKKYEKKNASSTLAKLASAQKGMRSEHVTQSNGGVVQKSSIRKLPNLSTDGSIL